MGRALTGSLLALVATGCGSSTTVTGKQDGAMGFDGPVVDSRPADGPADGLARGDGPATDGTPDAAATDGPRNCAGTCHGNADNAAPPLGVRRETASSDRAVGAHQTHLAASSWHRRVVCADCHLVPAMATAPDHIDGLPAEITFSSLADPVGLEAAWDGTTCTTYCHGATLSGGQHTAPQWTVVDGSQTTCNGCHGFPPTENHPASTNCGGCHGAVVDGNNEIKAPVLHIDGQLQVTSPHAAGWAAPEVHGPAFFNDVTACGGSSCHGDDLGGGSGRSCASSGCHPSGWQSDCTFCHGGTDNQSGAPPEAVNGETAVSYFGVGQHSTHLDGTTHKALGCEVCHTMPTDALSPGHIDPAPAEVQSSYITGHVPGLGCIASCHYNRALVWNREDYVVNCTWCHGTRGGKHVEHADEGLGCSECHDCVVDATLSFVDPSRHVDGTRDYCGPAGYDAVARTCALTCHGKEHEGLSWY
jgi:hypothetical protein